MPGSQEKIHLSVNMKDVKRKFSPLTKQRNIGG